MIRNPIAKLGKEIEWWGRALRPYLKPSCHRFVNERLALPPKLMETQKVVIFDIASVRIDKVAGRYFFHLVHDFIQAGFQPAFKSNFRFVATFMTARYKGDLLQLPHLFCRDVNTIERAYKEVILITDRQSVFDSSSIEHRVFVNYEYRRAAALEIPLTFGLGPGLLRQNEQLPQIDRTQPRDMKLFFAGNTSTGYGQDFLGKAYRMLNRREVIESVKKHFSDLLYVPPPVDDDTEPLPKAEAPIVLISKEQRRIDPSIWLNTIVRSDFFLACPGVEMPMCHNLVEALSVGTIPIIEYEAYLEPGLIDGVNCLAFRGEDGLRRVVQKALDMDVSELEQLRLGVVQFYEQYYAPGKMAERIVSQSLGGNTLIMNDYRIPRTNG